MRGVPKGGGITILVISTVPNGAAGVRLGEGFGKGLARGAVLGCDVTVYSQELCMCETGLGFGLGMGSGKEGPLRVFPW